MPAKEVGVPFREVNRLEITEAIRRWQMNESVRQIARATGLSRNTVDKYISAAKEAGVEREGDLPDEAVLRRLLCLGDTSSPTAMAPRDGLLGKHREDIERWLKKEDLTLTRIQELLAQGGTAVPYTTLRRYVRHEDLWKRSGGTVRMPDWPPGEAAEMDFGKLGQIYDATLGKRRVLWALVIVLVHSRHQFVWPMYQQTLAESIAGLEAAWRFFGGIVPRLLLDNFPAAVAGPDRENPRLTRGFLEYCQARGFLADPARAGRPKDKPHVERDVPYVRERFFKGGNFYDLADSRNQAETWCRDVAGLRIHGTTRWLPLEVFEAKERALLLPYDDIPYDVPVWKEVTVHPDHHISFLQALYSAPATTCPPGTQLQVRGGKDLVTLFRGGELVKVHPHQPRGGRATDPDDYPKEKTTYALRSTDAIVHQAARFGASVKIVAQRLFDGPVPWARIRSGQGLISLGERYGGERLEAACARALEYDVAEVGKVRSILLRALEQEKATTAEDPRTPLGSRFARSPGDFDRRQQALAEASG